jgi:hypothetical protein
VELADYDDACSLIRSRIKDADRTFLDLNYVTRVITDLEKTAGKPISGADVAADVEAQSVNAMELATAM